MIALITNVAEPGSMVVRALIDTARATRIEAAIQQPRESTEI
jgi:hypothetical protein